MEEPDIHDGRIHFVIIASALGSTYKMLLSRHFDRPADMKVHWC